MPNGSMGVLALGGALFGVLLDIGFDDTVSLGNALTVVILLGSFIYSWATLAQRQRETTSWRTEVNSRLAELDKELSDQRERIVSLAVGMQALGGRVESLEVRR